MKLITELTEEIEAITEEVGGKKHFHIHGVFLQSEIKNRNGRCYPKAVMESAVERYMDKVKSKTAYGEFGHPSGPKINEERISHLITEMKWDGNNVIGKARVFSKGLGAIIQGIMEEGGRMGVSSRGLGSIKKNSKGIMEVQNDFYLATAADCVVDPSAPQAFVNGVMENCEWVQEAGEWIKKDISEIRSNIKRMSLSQINENKFKLFEDFVNALKNRVTS
jgi:hypothetical protein